MELKSDHHTSFWRDPHRSNRTFMELKFNAKELVKDGYHRSNRTFMELK